MAKRVLDVTLTLLLAPPAAFATLLAAVALAIELRGNPFFMQRRIGREGVPFTMIKLRTMHHAQPGQEPPRVVDDFDSYVFDPPGQRNPRLTRTGDLCRSLSIDELPNLINVFKGEMSLVGPRPELPELVDQFPDHYHRRHDLPPGITGLAQVTGRSDLTYGETIARDLDYIDRQSLLTDLGIIARTFGVVAGKGGAR